MYEYAVVIPLAEGAVRTGTSARFAKRNCPVKSKLIDKLYKDLDEKNKVDQGKVRARRR